MAGAAGTAPQALPLPLQPVPAVQHLIQQFLQQAPPAPQPFLLLGGNPAGKCSQHANIQHPTAVAATSCCQWDCWAQHVVSQSAQLHAVCVQGPPARP